MYKSPRIDPQIAQIGISESVSRLGLPKVRKTTSKRNDNPVSRFFKQKVQSKISRKAANDAMCAHCMGCTAKEQGFPQEDWIEPGFRKQIQNCCSHSCPLWDFRPFK
jgi:hypothetical protein